MGSRALGKKRLLFVDDEENILEGLRVMLRSIRKDWDISMTTSGQDALRLMEEEAPFDLVVSDMRMPGMHGTEFLREVKDRYPLTIRFGLSGETDSATMLKALSITHQFLQKPCEPKHLHALLARALVMREQLRNDDIQKLLMDLDSLPGVPKVCEEVLAEINSPDPSIGKIGEIIKQDPAVATKILQIVNSAYLGLRHEVSDIAHAVNLLGMRNVRDVVVMVGMFTVGEGSKMASELRLDDLWSHSMSVASFAKKIAESESPEPKVAHDAFTGGLLHEVGQVVLALQAPEAFSKALEIHRKDNIPLIEAEKRTIGVTHPEAGGFLLELWGLPDAVVEAITFHALPTACPDQAFPDVVLAAMDEEPEEPFSPLVAVHVANYLCEDDEGMHEDKRINLDTPYLNRLGLVEKVGDWWDICHRD